MSWSPVLQGLVGVVFAAITAVIGVLGRWLLTRTTSVVGGQVIASAWEVVQSVVAHVEVEIRPDVQAAFSDGKLTAEEGAKLKTKALELVKHSLAESGMAALQKALKMSSDSAVLVYLSGLIERALGLQRAAGTLPPAPPPSTGTKYAPGIPNPAAAAELSDPGRTAEFNSPPLTPR